ncbi:MAG: hypothetical protein KGH98_01625 [Candidatus Micrarchaeota archaeon]|nr:hypothetical protein [Candidatus Micrarchaeota archaeon]
MDKNKIRQKALNEQLEATIIKLIPSSSFQNNSTSYLVNKSLKDEYAANSRLSELSKQMDRSLPADKIILTKFEGKVMDTMLVEKFPFHVFGDTVSYSNIPIEISGVKESLGMAQAPFQAVMQILEARGILNELTNEELSSFIGEHSKADRLEPTSITDFIEKYRANGIITQKNMLRSPSGFVLLTEKGLKFAIDRIRRNPEDLRSQMDF